MRLAFVGNGSLGDPNAVVRDGTVADRLALFDALEQGGANPVYIAPKERSPGDDRVVGQDWVGDVDALILEVRDAVWPPQVGCLAKEEESCDLAHVAYDECVDFALTRATGIPVYWQARTLKSWLAGDFGNIPVLLWDFDLNARRVFGLAGRESTYVLGKFWRKAVPWMGDVLEQWRMDERSRVLVPYDPSKSAMEMKKGKRREERYELRRFYWSYPEWLEIGIGEFEINWDMVYTGSDYDRRRRWDAFYGEWMRRGDNRRVAVTGTWGNRRRGRDKPPWNENGYRTRLEEEFGDKLEFLSPSTTGQLAFMECMEALSQALFAVQVVPDEYAALGYYTNRIAEAAARGVPILIDSEIHEGHLFGRPVTGYEDMERFAKAVSEERNRVEFVSWHRSLLKAQTGAKANAERLVDICSGG